MGTARKRTISWYIPTVSALKTHLLIRALKLLPSATESSLFFYAERSQPINPYAAIHALGDGKWILLSYNFRLYRWYIAHLAGNPYVFPKDMDHFSNIAEDLGLYIRTPYFHLTAWRSLFVIVSCNNNGGICLKCQTICERLLQVCLHREY